MNLFETVKASVNLREAATHYGVEVNRSSMALCPFHNDKHPSLFVADDHYHCFACGAHGDVIDFAANLFGLSLYEAAQRVAADFGLSPDKPPTKEVLARCKKKSEVQQLRENERLCISVLSAYRQCLRDWMLHDPPQSPAEEPDGRFVEACHQLDHVEYLLDVLLLGDSLERAETVNYLLTDHRLSNLQRHLSSMGKEVPPHGKRKEYEIA